MGNSGNNYLDLSYCIKPKEDESYCIKPKEDE